MRAQQWLAAESLEMLKREREESSDESAAEIDAYQYSSP